MRHGPVVLRFLIASSVLAAEPMALFAQTVPSAPAADAGDSATLQEIVVTSEKRSENLQDVPITVTAVSAADLQAAGIDAGPGLARVTPNLTVYSGTGFFSPYLRGVGSQYATLGLESSVATYFDDLYMSRPTAGLVSFNDIARIEVLKGPQGTLFGRNAAGGAIRIITNDPVLDDWESSAAVTYGRFGRIAAEGVLNAPIAPTLAARIAYYHDSDDGYVTNVDPAKPRLNNLNINMIRGKLLFEPSDNFKTKLSVDYSDKRDFDGVAEMPVAAAPGQTGLALGGIPSPGFYVTSDDAPYSDRDKWHIQEFGASLRTDWILSNVTFSSITGYRWANFLNPVGEIDATSLPYLQDTFHEWSSSWSQELEAMSAQSGRVKWLAGLYYFEETGGTGYSIYGMSINDMFGVPSGPDVGMPDGGATINADGRLRTKSLAPYAQTTVDLSDQWQILLGGRYTSESKELLSNQVFAGGLGAIPTPLADEFNNKLDFNKFTPKVTLSFEPTKGVMTYATYSVGFKSGGFNTPAFGAIAGTVKPEDLKSYELGWKSEFSNIRFDGATFYYNYQNMQVQRTDPATSTTILTNAASAEIYGIESDLTWAPTRRLELGASDGWLHSKFKDYLGDAYVPCASNLALAGCAGGLGYGIQSADFSGKPLPFVSTFSFNVHSQFTQPLPDRLGSLRFNALFSYSSPFFYNPEQSLSEPSHHLLSGGITWESEDQKYNVGVFGNNLLNQEYNLLEARQGDGGWRIPAAPLTWGVRFGVRL